MKYLYLIIILGISNLSLAKASGIGRISFKELEKESGYIVMAKVLKVVKKGNTDIVTIRVGKFLKGKSLQTNFTFILVTRGGLKDFDPKLKIGDSGVFFLKTKKPEGQVEKAYWGSVAIFNKNHFDISK